MANSEQSLDGIRGGSGERQVPVGDLQRPGRRAHGEDRIRGVGLASVPGPRPYTLLVTNGFSHILSPEADREGVHHEYSLAVPAGTPLEPWADALLRHECRYILDSGADIQVDDCVPFHGVPMTRIPFPREHHAPAPPARCRVIATTAAPEPTPRA